jgi:hypothetical protein
VGAVATREGRRLLREGLSTEEEGRVSASEKAIMRVKTIKTEK